MLRWMCCAVCFVLFYEGYSSAEVLEVGEGKPYPTIRQGLRAASPGDIVLVSPGIYEGAGLFVGEGVTLAATGQGSTVLVYGPEVMSYGNILSCSDSTVIRGFWLVGAPVSVVSPFRQPTFRLENCVICGNKSVTGPHYPGWRAVITNCTIFGNQQGVVCEEGSTAGLYNTIVWGNRSNLVGNVADISASHCDIEGGWPGEGNIDADPMFVRQDAFDWNGMPSVPTLEPIEADFRLRQGSPCIDAGDNKAARSMDTDVAGRQRIMYGGKSFDVDIGAYEYFGSEVRAGPTPGAVTLTWGSFPDTTYSIFYSGDLLTWHLAVEDFPSAGDTTSWIDDGSRTGVSPWAVPRRFYRARENQ